MLVLLFEACALAGAVCLILGYRAHRLLDEGSPATAWSQWRSLVASFVLLNVTTHVETVTGVIAR